MPVEKRVIPGEPFIDNTIMEVFLGHTAVTRNNKHVSAAAELYQLYLRGVCRLDI